MTQLSIYLSPKDLQELNRQAKDYELPPATYARSLVLKGLKNTLNRSTGMSA